MIKYFDKTIDKTKPMCYNISGRKRKRARQGGTQSRQGRVK